MELAKITSKGQITIPKTIREFLGLKDGSKVLFLEENGRIIIENSSVIALKEIRKEFQGEARRLNIKNEDDVVNLVKETRQERQKEKNLH